MTKTTKLIDYDIIKEVKGNTEIVTVVKKKATKKSEEDII